MREMNIQVTITDPEWQVPFNHKDLYYALNNIQDYLKHPQVADNVEIQIFSTVIQLVKNHENFTKGCLSDEEVLSTIKVWIDMKLKSLREPNGSTL